MIPVALTRSFDDVNEKVTVYVHRDTDNLAFEGVGLVVSSNPQER